MNDIEDEKVLREHLRCAVVALVQIHDPYVLCWYHIQYIKGSDRNLSQYLNMKNCDYVQLLVEAGLAKTKGDQITYSEDTWQELFNEHDLQHLQVTKRRDTKRSTMKNLRWIRLGTVTDVKSTSKGLYDPVAQPDSIKVWTHENIQRKNQLDDGSGLASKALFVAKSIAGMRKERKEAEKQGTSNSSSAPDHSENAMEQEDAQLIDDDAGKNKYSILSNICNGKVKRTMLYALLREIVGFSKEFPDTFELRYETAHGKYNEIAIIPKVGTPASFHSNVKPLLKDLPRKLVSDFICKRRKQKNLVLQKKQFILKRKALLCTKYWITIVSPDKIFTLKWQKVED
jgi:hypothetical protein